MHPEDAALCVVAHGVAAYTQLCTCFGYRQRSQRYDVHCPLELLLERDILGCYVLLYHVTKVF